MIFLVRDITSCFRHAVGLAKPPWRSSQEFFELSLLERCTANSYEACNGEVAVTSESAKARTILGTPWNDVACTEPTSLANRSRL